MRRVLPLLFLATVASAGERLPRPWLGFPAYPGAKQLCGPEHVMGNSMEIHWESHTTGDAIAKVVAFYEKDRGAKAKKDGVSFEIRDKANDDLVLSIHPADDKYPTCSKKPGAGDKTVIVVSIAFRKK